MTEFANYETYGKIHEAVATDPEMAAWFWANEEGGARSWVRSSLMREVVI